MNRKLLSTTGLVTAAALLIVINMAASLVFKSSRIDMTDNQLYTLSSGTENILGNLDESVTLRFFFSEKFFNNVPAVKNYGQRVRDLLDEYVSLSNGNLKLIVADPEPFSEIEDQAVQYGLQGVPIDNSGNQAYFGLVGTNSTDDEEVIAFIQPDKEESLEYDITRLVYKLANPKQRVIGLISGLPMEAAAANPFMQTQGGPQDWYILNQLRQSFELKNLETIIEDIPSDVDVLMLAHPKGLSEKTLFAIDQFVMRGGRLIAFVDPFSEADEPAQDPQNPMAAMQAPRNSDLSKLLSAWGVEVVDGKIAGDRLHAQRVQAQMGRRAQPVDYVAWLAMEKENFNANDFITRDLEKMNFATAGHIKKLDGFDVEVTPLIETSVEAMEIASSQFQFGANPMNLLRNYKAGGEKLVLAARVSGNIKSAFPGGLKDGDTTKDGIKEAEQAANIILIADTDMLQDKFWVQVQNFFGNRIAMPLSNNDVFILNSIENLSGSNDLISLRSRSKSARPFEKIQELKRDAEKRFQDKEKELQDKLRETERKIAELQRKQDGNSSTILTAEQRREIAKFREEKVQTRKELRNVQHELIKSVESLGTTLKVINIGLMPLVIILLAIAIAAMRAKRLKRAAA